MLTTLIMATRAPVLFVPAMNTNMWQNPIYRENQEKLERHGYHFMAPVSGELACGWEGEGKLPEPVAIFDHAQTFLGTDELDGLTFLVTAGPTRTSMRRDHGAPQHPDSVIPLAIAAPYAAASAEPEHTPASRLLWMIE